MKEIFLEYAKKGVMTKRELAEILRVCPNKIDALRRRGVIRAVQALGRPYVFDPIDTYERLFDTSKQIRSLTSEKRNIGGNTKSGGFR
jgi:hypothetical protein